MLVCVHACGLFTSLLPWGRIQKVVFSLVDCISVCVLCVCVHVHMLVQSICVYRYLYIVSTWSTFDAALVDPMYCKFTS